MDLTKIMTKLTLYYDDVSPPVRSCMILTKMLDLDVEYKFLDLFKGEQLAPAFLELNPIHTVPTLVHEDLILTDSHIILMHLCEKFEKAEEGKELWPRDYALRMQVLNMLFFECSVLFRRDSEFLSGIVRGGFDSIDLALHDRKIKEAYSMMETFLQRRKYMACDHMTIADISIVTTLSTVNLMFPISDGAADKWCRLNEWFSCMQASLPMYQINQTGLNRLCIVIEKIGKFKFPNSESATSAEVKADKQEKLEETAKSIVK